jgi:transcriptional regulator with XRE-family HTH domain
VPWNPNLTEVFVEGQELAVRHIALREQAGLTQEQEAKMAGVSPTTISGIESGKITRPHLKTLLKIARALGADVGELRESGKVEAPPSSTQPPLNGFEEERRLSRLAEAIIGVAARWGEGMSNPDMDDKERGVLIGAALELSGLIWERVEGEEDWEEIPNQERLEIVTAMERLTEAASVGIRHAEESVEAMAQEEEAKQRREQIREWNRRESA